MEMDGFLFGCTIKFMELLQIVKLPLEVARFAGRQLLGGAWADLPPLPQEAYEPPKRIVRIPENIMLGEE